MYELDAILSSFNLSFKQRWEQTRMIGYIIAQCNSSKNLQPTDIIKFSWDSDTNEEHDKITGSDIARLKAKAELLQHTI